MSDAEDNDSENSEQRLDPTTENEGTLCLYCPLRFESQQAVTDHLLSNSCPRYNIPSAQSNLVLQQSQCELTTGMSHFSLSECEDGGGEGSTSDHRIHHEDYNCPLNPNGQQNVASSGEETYNIADIGYHVVHPHSNNSEMQSVSHDISELDSGQAPLNPLQANRKRPRTENSESSSSSGTADLQCEDGVTPGCFSLSTMMPDNINSTAPALPVTTPSFSEASCTQHLSDEPLMNISRQSYSDHGSVRGRTNPIFRGDAMHHSPSRDRKSPRKRTPSKQKKCVHIDPLDVRPTTDTWSSMTDNQQVSLSPIPSTSFASEASRTASGSSIPRNNTWPSLETSEPVSVSKPESNPILRGILSTPVPWTPPAPRTRSKSDDSKLLTKQVTEGLFYDMCERPLESRKVDEEKATGKPKKSTSRKAKMDGGNLPSDNEPAPPVPVSPAAGPYMHCCTHCEAKFKYESHLKAHVKDVHDYRPFQCDECPKKYKQEHHLVKHQSDKHSEEKREKDSDEKH